MTVPLTAVPRKTHDGSHSALEGMTYPQLVAIVDRMAAQDSRIVFDSLRPMGDELWNFVDGHRTVEEIAEVVCIEFGFELEPELFCPLLDGMAKIGLIEFEPAHS